jgi:F-type H+-transporting ATPase subunit epsilon
MQVELVSPEGVLYEGEATMVQARTVGGGDIGFLTGHEPFLGVLSTHPVKIRQENNQDLVIAVERGFIECTGSRVSILSDAAVIASQIDVSAAESDLAAAQEALRANGDDPAALAAQRWAEVRIAAARG